MARKGARAASQRHPSLDVGEGKAVDIEDVIRRSHDRYERPYESCRLVWRRRERALRDWGLLAREASLAIADTQPSP